MKTLTVDDRQRIRLPQVKLGQVFAYEPNSHGTIKLVPVTAKPGPKRIIAKLVKRGGEVFFQVPAGYTLDPEAIAKAVAEERLSRELLEKADDPEDTSSLKRARLKPLHYRPLEDYLAERNRK